MYRNFSTLFFLALVVSPTYGKESSCAAPSVTFEEALGIRGVPVFQVVGVTPGSVAESIGINRGDLITALNGKNMRHFGKAHDFSSEMRIEALADRAKKNSGFICFGMCAACANGSCLCYNCGDACSQHCHSTFST